MKKLSALAILRARENDAGAMPMARPYAAAGREAL